VPKLSRRINVLEDYVRIQGCCIVTNELHFMLQCFVFHFYDLAY
jgi:hypothetical protein